MKIITIIFSVLVLTSATYDYKTNVKQAKVCNVFKAIDTSKYAILKLDTTNYSYFDKKAKATTLSQAEIKKIEKLINIAVLKRNKEAGKYNHIVNPESYYKQIIATVNNKGEKIVWVNCLCSITNEKSYFKKYVVRVVDGGNCFFNLKINLTRQIVYDFAVNSTS